MIAAGTLPEQRSVTAPLEQIAEAARDLEAPALIVVGEVVGLAALLDAHAVVASALAA